MIKAIGKFLKSRSCLAECIKGLLLFLALASVVSTGLYLGIKNYENNRSPLRAQWDMVCGSDCTQTSVCSYVEEWEWKDTMCWGRAIEIPTCASIFSSPNVDVIVEEKQTRLPGGYYIYDKTDNQPYKVVKGPVDYCPSESRPDK